MVLEATTIPVSDAHPEAHGDVEANIAQDVFSHNAVGSKNAIVQPVINDEQRLCTTGKSDMTTPEDPSAVFPPYNKSKKSIRLGIAIFGVILLILGRLGVPEVEVPCVQDKVLDALEFANVFLLAPGNEGYRDFFQILCSIMVDLTCLVTFVEWIRRGTSYRLPLTLTVFYTVRAMIQAIWISPFTTGYYWESPGVPSLVVPYGRGSDFFFSGHTGFMLICMLEWHYSKNYKIRNMIAIAAVYTMLILLVYRIHYSIDIFTGAVFAEWAFIKVDKYNGVIADKIGIVVSKVLSCFGGKFGTTYKGV